MKCSQYDLNDGGIRFIIRNKEIFTTTCPYCNVTVKLTPINQLEKWERDQCHGFFYCPNCMQLVAAIGHLTRDYISTTDRTTAYKVENLQIFPSRHFTHSFSKEICEISPDFVEIYSQAMECKIQGYNQLVGMGFRKSIEFLITDYISKFLEESPKGKLEDRIKQLGFSEEDAIFADVVRLAGNDETHTKKTTDFSIEDMIFCIDVLTQKLVANIKSRNYIERKTKAGK